MSCLTTIWKLRCLEQKSFPIISLINAQIYTFFKDTRLKFAQSLKTKYEHCQLLQKINMNKS